MKRILWKIYLLIPFKKYVYLILKLFYKPPEKIAQYLQFVGNINIKIDSQHNFKMRHYGYQLENEIFWNGLFNGWEKFSIRLWYELCKESKNVFDIGANTGVYALIAKSLQPNATVYAFEPVDRVYDKLMYNNELNNYDIKCVKKAISNFDGSAIIYDKAKPHTYSVTVNKDISDDTSDSISVAIEAIRLDTFIELNNIPKVDLIKIDVETHEVEVLEGLGKYLRAFEPTLLVEILNEDVADGIKKLISGIDYVFYNIDENIGIRKVSQLSKSDYYNFLICKPEVASELEVLKQFTNV